MILTPKINSEQPYIYTNTAQETIESLVMQDSKDIEFYPDVYATIRFLSNGTITVETQNSEDNYNSVLNTFNIDMYLSDNNHLPYYDAIRRILSVKNNVERVLPTIPKGTLETFGGISGLINAFYLVDNAEAYYTHNPLGVSKKISSKLSEIMNKGTK